MTLSNLRFHFLWGVLLVGAWLQPDHFPPWSSFLNELMAFAAVAVLAVAMFKAESNHSRTLLIAAPEAAVVLIIVTACVQRAWNLPPHSGDTMVLLMYMVAMLLALAIGRGFVRMPYAAQTLAWAIGMAGLVSVFAALSQSLFPTESPVFITPMQNWRRPGGNLGQANQLGTLLLWAMASVGYLWWYARMSTTVALMMATLLLLGVSMTESRTALLGLLVMVSWGAFSPIFGTVRLRRILPLGVAMLGITFFFLWPFFLVGFHEGAWNADAVSHGAVNTQAGTRLVVWPQLVAAVLERPWLGWGIRGVSAALNAVLDRYSQSDPFTYAHNLVLELLVAFGVPLTTLLGAGTLMWMWRRVLSPRHISDWYAVALLIPFTLHSMLEFPFAYSYFLLPACIAVGMLDDERESRWALRVSRNAAISLWVVWCLSGALVVKDYVLAEEDFRVARFEALKIGHTPDVYEEPHLLVLTQLAAANAAIRVVPKLGMPSATMKLLEDAAHRFPWPAVQNRYALSLALNGNEPEAKRQLKIIRAMHGEKTYGAIQALWVIWGDEKYPQLRGFVPN